MKTSHNSSLTELERLIERYPDIEYVDAILSDMSCYYGYKNHITADRETKFIVDSCVTPASTHDSQMLFEVLSEDPAGDRQVWADSAYRSEEAIQQLYTNLGSITKAPVRSH